MRKIILLVCALLSINLFTTCAQDESVGQLVELSAVDGLTLVGDYYVAEGETRPAVLLLHQFGSNRGAWSPLIPPLLEAGYDVLAVDLRGFGDSEAPNDWELATGDVQGWLDWLREQEGVRAEAISIVGASIGSNLALIGCANDEACVTAIALSPGLNYFDTMPEESVTTGLRERSALLVAGQSDRESAEAVKQMAMNARGEIGLQLFKNSTHGTDMFRVPSMRDRVIGMIVQWLDDHTPEVET